MKHLLRKLRRDRQKGIGALEVALSAGLMIIIVALALDLTILNYAFSVNDAACRDAARAAAGTQYANESSSGWTTGQPDALDAANAALAMHHTDGVFISQPTLKSTAAPDFIYDNNASGPAWTPYSMPKTFTVTVTTSVNVKLPVPLFFWGNNFMNTAQAGGLASGGKLVFIRRYVFPIVRAGVAP